MTRKRFIKRLMGHGISRNVASKKANERPPGIPYWEWYEYAVIYLAGFRAGFKKGGPPTIPLPQAVRAQVCALYGVQEDEVEVVIDKAAGIIHATIRPTLPVEVLTFELTFNTPSE